MLKAMRELKAEPMVLTFRGLDLCDGCGTRLDPGDRLAGLCRTCQEPKGAGEMPRTCSVCARADRKSIDEALGTPEPYRQIARRFGISASSLFRHWRHGHWRSEAGAEEPKRTEAAANK
jgi:hypothetical protein